MRRKNVGTTVQSKEIKQHVHTIAPDHGRGSSNRPGGRRFSAVESASSYHESAKSGRRVAFEAKSQPQPDNDGLDAEGGSASTLPVSVIPDSLFSGSADESVASFSASLQCSVAEQECVALRQTISQLQSQMQESDANNVKQLHRVAEALRKARDKQDELVRQLEAERQQRSRDIAVHTDSSRMALERELISSQATIDRLRLEVASMDAERTAADVYPIE